ncbi:MAG: hypothetical protein EAZ21_16150 [Betaproteobacteria bacterium]|nr:MAG: hypothetical protein EAZ21_16150 [Betaproteobacteria bacterium]
MTNATPPDLNPTFTFGSTSFVVGQTREFIINIRDINLVGTTGTVQFFVPQPNGVAFDDYTFDGNATNAVLLSGSPAVNNVDWTAAPSGTGLLFELRPGLSIGAAQNYLSRIVIRATARDAGGKGAITANIVSNSGGEVRIDNNVVVLLTSVQR